MTRPAEEPAGLGAAGGPRAARARVSVLPGGAAALRDAIYGRLEQTRFRTGMAILAGCLITGAALAIGAAMLSRPAPVAPPPRGAAGPAAVTPASPLASSRRPRPERPVRRTPAPDSQQQHALPAAAGSQAPSPGPQAQAGTVGPWGHGPRCWAGRYPPGGGRAVPPCRAGGAPWSRWNTWPDRAGEPSGQR